MCEVGCGLAMSSRDDGPVYLPSTSAGQGPPTRGGKARRARPWIICDVLILLEQ